MAFRQVLSIKGVAASSLLAVVISLALTKPNASYQSSVLWWLGFVIASALIIDGPDKAWTTQKIVAVSAIPTGCLFGALFFRLGLQLLLFTFHATTFVILGSGIGTVENLQAEQREIGISLGSVDWGMQVLNEGGPNAYNVALEALNPTLSDSWTSYSGGNVARQNATELRRFLTEVERPDLTRRSEELSKQIKETAPGKIPAGRIWTLIIGLVFYLIIAGITLPALIVALYAKPELERALSALTNIPTKTLDEFRKKIDVLLKIVVGLGAIAGAVF